MTIPRLTWNNWASVCASIEVLLLSRVVPCYWNEVRGPKFMLNWAKEDMMTEEKIREIAHRKWEEKGRPDGAHERH
jgi:hypothetical protein